MRLLLSLLFLSRSVEAFVYSCEEVKYHLINSLQYGMTTTYVCVVVQEGYTNYDQLKQIIAEEAGEIHHLDVVARSISSCVTRQAWSSEPWRVLAPKDLNLDCKQEFTLFFTSDPSGVYNPLKVTNTLQLLDEAVTLVVPQTGMKIKKKKCAGSGIITVYGGAGNGVAEERYTLGDWTCADVPNWILSFDSVITIEADAAAFEFEFSSALTPDSRVTAANRDRIVVITNGKADDLQNLKGGIEHRACIEMANAVDNLATVNMNLVFDPKNTGAVALQRDYHGSESSFYNGTHTEQFTTEYFEIRYDPSGKQPSEIGNSKDDIFVEIRIGTDGLPSTTGQPAVPTTTRSVEPTTTVIPTPPPAGNDPYCNCAVDKFGFSNGWSSNDIWLDIVVILDTSEAMGAESLEDARELIESFISDGEVDFLITDPTAPYYTRVGVISMTDAAEVLYNLNMTKADKVQASIKKGLKTIDVKKAFDAASNMLKEGLTPDRANTRQVIYYMTDSDPKTIQDSINKFKQAGVIIVNNFLKDGETERPGLKQLASEGYYYSNTNYLAELQSFCKANCFCQSGKSAYGGADTALQASGGCYHPVTAGVPFNKAKTACSDAGGIIATVHEDEKAQFVKQLISKAASDYFWIGYEKSATSAWEWEDQSTDPYTNWDVNEPSSAAVSKCAYVDTTSAKLPWGAGNCQLGFMYVCQYAPCSVGNKNC